MRAEVLWILFSLDNEGDDESLDDSFSLSTAKGPELHLNSTFP